ncbi:MAG: hypothetical protein DRJ42_00315 [Deltaproteobacteria bacterium]|nr:MAG: hypothetical protein DRJ42_00315 [Deltaproteobacteria bacterium]
MAIRDLGYRPYEGERLPASHNTVVLLRHGLTRAWGSWLVKIAAFTAWAPALIAMFYLGTMTWIMQQQAGQMPGQELPPPPGADFVKALFAWQFWGFLSLIGVGAGAGAIAEDITFKAFSFYFAKPVTPPQYLAGRIAAVAIWCFALTFLPSFLVVGMLAGISPEEMRVEQAGLILPALLHSVLISVVVATGSVGMSSLSGSRALTMSAWLIVLVIPQILALIVDTIADWPWLYLVSIYELLSIVGDALFRIEPANDLRWYYALPLLGLVVAGALAMAWRRVRGVEVIA